MTKIYDLNQNNKGYKELVEYHNRSPFGLIWCVAVNMSPVPGYGVRFFK